MSKNLLKFGIEITNNNLLVKMVVISATEGTSIK